MFFLVCCVKTTKIYSYNALNLISYYFSVIEGVCTPLVKAPAAASWSVDTPVRVSVVNSVAPVLSNPLSGMGIFTFYYKSLTKR